MRCVSCLAVISLLIQSTTTAQAGTRLRPWSQGSTVSPATVSFDLQLGETATFTMTVRTAATPIPKVDVLFMFDVTSSMGEEIEEAKTRGVFIMNSLRARVPDSAFGVASFADYPGTFTSPGYAAEYGSGTDYPWRLDQAITQDTAVAQRGIESLVLQNGNDGPESYATALYETLYIDWRPAAKHIVVLFGDAPAHDPEFYLPYGGEDYGLDPGPDAQVGTADDLRFADVVAQLRDRGIEVIPVNSNTDGLPQVQAGFEYLAQQTSGQVYSLGDVADLPNVVASGLASAIATISSLTILSEAGYEAWTKVSPEQYADVAGDETRAFQITIQPPDEAPSGLNSFTLTVTGDSASLGATVVTVTVGGGFSLDPAAALAEKRDLVRQLSTLKIETEFMGIPVELSQVATYQTQESEIQRWLDALPAGALTPAQHDAIYRLGRQEQALHSLWQGNAALGHVGNSQMAHMVGVVVSIISIWSKISTFLHKSIVGRLVSKLDAYIFGKLANMLTTCLHWVLSGIEDDLSSRDLAAALTLSNESLGSALENSLKTTNFARDFNADFLFGLLEGVVVTPLDIATNEVHVLRTSDLVVTGLQEARDRSSASVELADVERAAPQVVSEITALVDPVDARVNALQTEQKQLEKTQDMLSLASDLTATGGTLLAMTGFGGLAGTVGHLISLGIKATDILLSGNLATRAYVSWSQLPQIATQATDAAFAIPLPISDSSPDAGTGIASSALFTSYPAIGYGAGFYRRPASLSPHLDRLYTRLEIDVDHYLDQLDQLATAVNRRDTANTEPLVDALIDADAVVNGTFLTVRQPVLAAAPALFAAEDQAFEAAYAELGMRAAHFDGEGAKLYVYLLGLMLEPDSAEVRQLVLDQIAVVRGETGAYVTALGNALPMVPATSSEAAIVISGYTLPESIVAGQPATLAVEVTNPSTIAAEDVTLTLSAGDQTAPGAESTQSLDRLEPGATRSAAFEFTPQSEAGLMTVLAQPANGRGTLRMIAYVTSGSLVPPTGGGGGGLGLIVGLGLILGTVAIAFAARRRKDATGKGASGATALLVGTAGQGSYTVRNGSVIGRAAGVDLQLLDETVSRRHAQLRFAQGRWYIQDLGSTGGTFVNGQLVQAGEIRSGDMITLGEASFVFQPGPG